MAKPRLLRRRAWTAALFSIIASLRTGRVVVWLLLNFAFCLRLLLRVPFTRTIAVCLHIFLPFLFRRHFVFCLRILLRFLLLYSLLQFFLCQLVLPLLLFLQLFLGFL